MSQLYPGQATYSVRSIRTFVSTVYEMQMTGNSSRHCNTLLSAADSPTCDCLQGLYLTRRPHLRTESHAVYSCTRFSWSSTTVADMGSRLSAVHNSRSSLLLFWILLWLLRGRLPPAQTIKYFKILSCFFSLYQQQDVNQSVLTRQLKENCTASITAFICGTTCQMQPASYNSICPPMH